MIEIRMKIHLVSDNNVTLCIYNAQKKLQGMKNSYVYMLCWRHYMGGLQLVLSKILRIGDTKYNV
jgi:hypothetical protein